MRALAHPVRLALLEHLSQLGEGATATECATVVGLSPSATSYHLRALAKAGMIHEAPSRGDARERVWRARYEKYDVGSEPDASADVIAAEAALIETFLARQNDKVRRFMAVAREGAREWFGVALVSELTLAVTARELKQLTTQIDELIEPFRTRSRQRPPRTARTVSFQIRAVPTDVQERRLSP